MLARVIDFETTGMPTEDDRHAIVEAGWCDVTDGIPEEFYHSLLVSPGRSIPVEAMAVHHITDADVADAGPPDLAVRSLMVGPPDLFVAHNTDFEREFFEGGGIPWVCTYKVSLRKWPDAPSHSNQALRYFLGLDVDREFATPAHRAGPDAYVTARLFARLLAEGVSIDDMVRWSSGPALLPTITFGKHKGARWEDLPTDYLEWMAHKADQVDRDAKANARHHLRLRGKL